MEPERLKLWMSPTWSDEDFRKHHLHHKNSENSLKLRHYKMNITGIIINFICYLKIFKMIVKVRALYFSCMPIAPVPVAVGCVPVNWSLPWFD